MDKKQLKQDRIRGYFIEAACDIIEESGLSETSVRKVAERAGYHYTTIYTHFDDFNQVLHYAILRFLSRISDSIESHIRDLDDPLEKYVAGWEAYCKYLMEHPNVARCVVVERIIEVSDAIKSTLSDNPLAQSQRACLKMCVDAGYIREDLVQDVANMMAFTCTGCVVQYLNGHRGLNEEEALRVVGRAVRAILTSVGVQDDQKEIRKPDYPTSSG